MRKSNKANNWPALLWYPRDARSDVGLQTCSIGARGLWYEMLWIMFDSPKRGQLLTPGGKKISPENLAKLVGIEATDCEQLLSELETENVFSTLKDGTIYNRRMARDEEQRMNKVRAGRASGRARERATEGPTEREQPLKNTSSITSSSSISSSDTDTKIKEEKIKEGSPPEENIPAGTAPKKTRRSRKVGKELCEDLNLGKTEQGKLLGLYMELFQQKYREWPEIKGEFYTMAADLIRIHGKESAHGKLRAYFANGTNFAEKASHSFNVFRATADQYRFEEVKRDYSEWENFGIKRRTDGSAEKAGEV